MKKILSIILCCLMLIGSFFSTPFDNNSLFVSVYAADPLTYTLNYDKASYTVSKCLSSQTGILTIPDRYKDLPVTAIGNNAFENCKITGIVIGDNIKSIGSEAFYGCLRLNSVRLGKCVKSIGSDAFYSVSGCSVYISDLEAWLNISFFDESANPANQGRLYLNDTRVTELIIPEGVTEISKYAFFGCKGLTVVSIPDSVETIGKNAFSSTEIKEVVLGNGVKRINSYAFSNMLYLETVTFGENIELIENYAFNGDNNLNKVYINDLSSWLKLKFSSFYNNPLSYGASLYCDGTLVENLTIPEGITEINDYAFYGCQSINSVSFPASIKIIGSHAFDSCTNLKDISLSSVLEYVGIDVFLNCGYYNDSTKWENSGLYLSANLMAVDKNFSGPFAVKAGTVFVADYAAYQNTGITHLVLADSVEVVGSNAFSGCKGLTQIIFGKNLLSIGKSAFYNCSRLDIINFNDKLKEIDSSAFYNCSGISYVYINDLANWCGINFSDYSSNPVFYAKSMYVDNEKITDIEIPMGVERIGKNAFYNMADIESITIPSSMKEISSYAFYGCSGTADVYISDLAAWCNIQFEDGASNPLFCKGDLYLDGKLLDSVYVPQGVEIIRANTFYRAYGINSVVLPSTVTTIEQRAFGLNSSIKSVTIPETVTEISDNIFSYPSDVTVYCYENSYAHTYCQTQEIPYVLIDIAPVEGAVIDYENNLIFTSVQAGQNVEDIAVTSTDMELNLTNSGSNPNFLNTADIVSVYKDGAKVGDYTVVVDGDTNGDGVCDVLDCAQMALVANGLKTIDGAYALAADSNADNVVDINDYQSVVNKALAS